MSYVPAQMKQGENVCPIVCKTKLHSDLKKLDLSGVECKGMEIRCFIMQVPWE